jgi:hypothetical protein
MTGLVENQADGGDYSRDPQIDVETRQRDGLTANQRTERETKKQGAIVPSKDGRAAAGKLLR